MSLSLHENIFTYNSAVIRYISYRCCKDEEWSEWKMTEYWLASPQFHRQIITKYMNACMTLSTVTTKMQFHPDKINSFVSACVTLCHLDHSRSIYWFLLITSITKIATSILMQNTSNVVLLQFFQNHNLIFRPQFLQKHQFISIGQKFLLW